MGELLQELRVIGSGVQILFGFLLASAFQTRFPAIGTVQKVIYVVALLLAALTTGLLIGPVAVHRSTFHEGVEDDVVRISNRLSVLGLTCLSLSMTGSVLLVVNLAGGSAAALPCAVFVAAALGTLWWLIPARTRGRRHR